MNFTTVFFDIDYCLLDTPTSERRIIKELYAQQGQTVGDEVGDKYREINRDLWVYLDRGEITRERLYVMRFEKLFSIYPFFKAAEEVAPWFLDKLAHAYDAQAGAEHLLKRMRDSGVKIFTASNGIGSVMNGRVENAGLAKYLTGCFAADEIGAMKPSRKYFDYIFKHSGETDLKKTLMIGDNPVTDVNGAVEYGMVGALFGARWQEPSKAAYAAETMEALEQILLRRSEKSMKNMLKTVMHKVDICVIGGGIGGMFTAISAARHGAKVLLMQDRPVLGGNASSEIRMWISGAGTRVRDLQETGIMEELLLENMYRNPTRNFTTWDALLYEKVRFEENIELLLNCACCEATAENGHISSVKGFQLTTYTWHEVQAEIFVDSSGDSILAPLTGAEFKVGREAKSEYNEEFGLETADNHTMGMSIMMQCRETDHPISYTPPAWAYDFPDDDAMNNKPHNLYAINTNFYWIELGGMQNSIDDTEETKDELLKIAFGVWDHIKNHGDHGAENWDLEWVGFLPGKRESRRYVGDYVLTQHDVENCTPFEDVVAYGGWQIDNHLPGGFHMDAKGGAHLQKRRLSEPYPIPLRSLYSKNIDNLMFAGRNISASHIAFSSTRVMGTIGVIGQAAGTAAAIAVKNNLLPREAAQQKIGEIQSALLEDDCFLPGLRRKPSPLAQTAKLTCDYGDCSNLLNGLDRRIWGNDNGYFGKTNKAITYTFDEPQFVEGVRLVLDSDLDREYTEGNPDGLHTSAVLFFPASHNNTKFGFPKCLIKHYRIEILDESGQWDTALEITDNHQRFIKHTLNTTAKAVRFVPLSTYHSETKTEDYGSSTAHVFNFEVY